MFIVGDINWNTDSLMTVFPSLILNVSKKRSYRFFLRITDEF